MQSITQSLWVRLNPNLVCMFFQWPEVQCARIITLHFLLFELLPFVIFHTLFCLGHFSYTIKVMDLNIHRLIDLIEKKCRAQRLVLCTSWFFGLLPFLLFILYFCQGLVRMIDFIGQMCSAQEHRHLTQIQYMLLYSLYTI